MTCQMMTSLGVYVLGAADAGERQRVADHLPGCPECQAELRRLAPLPGLLARVPEKLLTGREPAGGSGRTAAPSAAAGAIRPGRSRRGWRGWPAAAAAVPAAAAAGAAAGIWLAPGSLGQAVSGQSPASGQPPATVTLSGANPARHLTASAALTQTSWGTSIRLRLRGIPRDVLCHLIIRSRGGQTEVAGAWAAWRAGLVSVPASAAWRPSDIASLQVRTATGDLVTISARHGPPPGGRGRDPERLS